MFGDGCITQEIPISTHAPAGGATFIAIRLMNALSFLLTPLREGRPAVE